MKIENKSVKKSLRAEKRRIQESKNRAENLERLGVSIVNRAIYKQEAYEHAVELAAYEDEMEYVSAKSRTNRAKELVGFKQYVTADCDNIALKVDDKGGYCSTCDAYHFKYSRTGAIVKCNWNPHKNRDCMSFGEQPVAGRINCGKYESDWTVPDDEEAFGPDEPEEKPVPHKSLAMQLLEEAQKESDEYFEKLLASF